MILLTGGAGYIGSQTNFALLEQGYKTVVVDRRLGDGKAIVPPGSIGIKADLLEYPKIKAVFKKHPIEAVIHFAALIQAGESVAKPLEYYRNNVVDSLNLFQAMVEAGVTKLVFSSTAAVYGLPASSRSITEETPKQPINPYGSSKLMVEQILEDALIAHRLSSIRLRYFNACGADPKQRTGENHQVVSHLIPIVLEVAQGKRQSLTVNGRDYRTPDGTCVRDYIHTVDLAAAHLAALEVLKRSEKPFSQAINLGTNQGWSVLEIVREVERVTGRKVPLQFGPRRPGDPDRLVADSRLAKKVLSWQPTHSDLETIIRTSWRWATR